jgi:23S rRNA pseudouridine1911/1915/1917 synthase
MKGAEVLRIEVPEGKSGVRVDRVVADALVVRGITRAEVQRWIDDGRVTHVSGAKRKGADKARPGDVFLVRPMDPPATAALPDVSVVFTVLYVDDDLVVVDKPAGLVVHPAAGHPTGTLVNGLLARGYFDRELLESPDEGPGDEDEVDGAHAAAAAAILGSEAAQKARADGLSRMRPGIVHRIDRDTSGVLVVARTAFAREKLKVEFAAHTIDRVYEALVLGDVDARTFTTFYGRHPRDRKLFSSKVREGKRAVTHVSPKARFSLPSRAGTSQAGTMHVVATHVECRLETGRTHQIRVHLADAGHSLLGDAMYGSTPKDPQVAAIARALGRQALHARKLGFRHPRTGAPMVFESEPPEDFRKALEALRALGGREPEVAVETAAQAKTRAPRPKR